MMLLRVALLVSLVLVPFSCTEPDRYAETRTLKPQPLQAESLNELGNYTRMVALETHQDALLGSITKVALDPLSGEIFVADTRVNHSVYRFDSEGRYLSRYGGRGEGPGEYAGLKTFALRATGELVLFAMGKRLLFDRQGRLLKSVPSRTNDFFACDVNGTLYIYSHRGLDRIQFMVTILNDELEEVGRFHPYEERIEKLPMVASSGLAQVGNKVVVNHSGDFGISLYEYGSKNSVHLRFPSFNNQMTHIWQKSKQEVRKNMRQFGRLLHRAEAIHGVGDYVYLQESRLENNLSRSVLWDSETDTAWSFEGIRLVRAPEEAAYLSMDTLVGHYERGLIGACTDPEKFARYQAQYPVARQIRFGDSDNPVLLFFELKPPGATMTRLGEKQ